MTNREEIDPDFREDFDQGAHDAITDVENFSTKQHDAYEAGYQAGLESVK